MGQLPEIGEHYPEIWPEHDRGEKILEGYPSIIQKTAVRVRQQYTEVMYQCKYKCYSTPSVDAAIMSR